MVAGLLITSGVEASIVLPHTSFTTGNAVGAVAAEAHSTMLLVATGPPTSAGAVERTML